MAVIIAMLRGVNVGGHNKIKMEDLRGLCKSLKLRDACTYVQSGNLIFRTEERDLALVAKRLTGRHRTQVRLPSGRRTAQRSRNERGHRAQSLRQKARRRTEQAAGHLSCRRTCCRSARESRSARHLSRGAAHGPARSLHLLPERHGPAESFLGKHRADLEDLRNWQKLEQRDENVGDRRATRSRRLSPPSLDKRASYRSCPTTIPPPCGIFSPG